MKDLARLYDDALDYENEIEDGINEITEIRLRMYKERNPEVLKYIVPVLNTIISDAETYREWIESNYE